MVCKHGQQSPVRNWDLSMAAREACEGYVTLRYPLPSTSKPSFTRMRFTPRSEFSFPSSHQKRQRMIARSPATSTSSRSKCGGCGRHFFNLATEPKTGDHLAH